MFECFHSDSFSGIWPGFCLESLKTSSPQEVNFCLSAMVLAILKYQYIVFARCNLHIT